MKLVIQETDSEQARNTLDSFLRRGYSLHTVDIALAESLNALWKHATIHKDLKPDQAVQATQDLIKIHEKLGTLTTHELGEDTLNTALAHKTTVYDALYIAATRKLNATLLTADGELHNTAKVVTNTRLLQTH